MVSYCIFCTTSRAGTLFTEISSAMNTSASLSIGTSGWNYDHWRGSFYPEDLSTKDWLSYYAERFGSVEINSSFYRLPSEKSLSRWRGAVPEEFTFAFKANRYITHMKKLTDPEEPLRTLYDRASMLGDKLGPILFQLPPNWRFNGERLAAFLSTLSPDYRHVFELRDERWITPEALDLLRQHECAFCIYDFAGRQSPREVTGNFVYIRLHGPMEEPYRGAYTTQTLSGWAGAISTWRRHGHDVCCYFDNDEEGYAAQNARELQQMLT